MYLEEKENIFQGFLKDDFIEYRNYLFFQLKINLLIYDFANVIFYSMQKQTFLYVSKNYPIQN